MKLGSKGHFVLGSISGIAAMQALDSGRDGVWGVTVLFLCISFAAVLWSVIKS